MIDVLIATFLAAVATKAALDAWFEGNVFALARAYAEAWRSSDRKVVSLFGELLSCRFCLGYHASFVFSIICCLLLNNWLFVLLVAFAARGMEYEMERYLRSKYDPKE